MRSGKDFLLKNEKKNGANENVRRAKKPHERVHRTQDIIHYFAQKMKVEVP
jgi:hypothetical protein